MQSWRIFFISNSTFEVIPPNPIGVTEYRIGCKPYQCNARTNTNEPRRGDRV